MKEKKEKSLHIRMTQEHYEKIKISAMKQGVPLSILIRHAIEYMPGTATDEEIKKDLDRAKTYNSSGVLFALKSITDMIRQEYNYEFDYVLPSSEILINMYDTEIFKSLNNNGMKSITDRLIFDPNYKLDKNTERTLKDLISAYMKR